MRTYRGYIGGYRAIIGQPILVSPIIIVDRGYRDNGKENGNHYIIIGYICIYGGSFLSLLAVSVLHQAPSSFRGDGGFEDSGWWFDL